MKDCWDITFFDRCGLWFRQPDGGYANFRRCRTRKVADHVIRSIGGRDVALTRICYRRRGERRMKEWTIDTGREINPDSPYLRKLKEE